MSHPNSPHPYACGSADHWSRRNLLRAAGWSGLAWLTPLGDLLALDAERHPDRPKSIILLWLQGAPSQLETFDPHPDSPIAYGTTDRSTAASDVRIASALEQTAEIMDEVTLVRSMVSKEGDHQRATYNIKTGYRPDPTLKHPSIGAVLCHEMPASSLEIPAHLSILPGAFPSRGGYFGAEFDAFQIGDPVEPLPDMEARAGEVRFQKRLEGLSVVEDAFAAGRAGVEETTLHRITTERARRMMSSAQLKAFDVTDEPAAVRAAYGDSAFGRGCLAARRLVEAGVRCIEITLKGWDTHVNNHELQARQAGILDPAFAALVRDLKERDLLDTTVVLCGGEFGRTPKLNPLEGRDHWPHGFSVALAGGGFRRGIAVGETDPTGETQKLVRPVRVEDLHATVQTALGIDPELELMTPVGRPLALSDGRIIRELLA